MWTREKLRNRLSNIVHFMILPAGYEKKYMHQFNLNINSSGIGKNNEQCIHL